MVDHDNDPMGVRLATFLIWGLVAGSAVHWGLHLWAVGQPAQGSAVPAVAQAALRGDVGHVLGREPSLQPASAVPAPGAALPDARFRLLGVVAPRGRPAPEARGLALISIDGAPARAFREGARVDGAQWLLKVEPRRAHLGARAPAQGATLVLELPELPSTSAAAAPVAATGVGLAAPRITPGSLPRAPALAPAPGAASPSLRPAPASPQAAEGAATPAPAVPAEPSAEPAPDAGAGSPALPMRRPGPALR